MLHLKHLRISAFFISMLCLSFSVFSASFNENSTWEFSCTVKNVPGHPATNSPNEQRQIKITWFRDAGHARILYPNGNGKGLREIPGFAETNQNSAHFWMSPATSKYTGEETKNSQYGGWIEAFGPTMVSLRSTGAIAITRHDIIYGGMKPFSETGHCVINSY